MDVLPNELWIKVLANLEFSEIWGLRLVSATVRAFSYESLARKLREGSFRVRIGWSPRDEPSNNVVDLSFVSVDTSGLWSRFIFRPASHCAEFAPPSHDDGGFIWRRDFGPLNALDNNENIARLPISRSWTLLDQSLSKGDWSEDLRCWPPALLRSYPASDDYTLDVSLSRNSDGTRFTVHGLISTATFIMPALLNSDAAVPRSASTKMLRKKLPLYEDHLIGFVRERWSALPVHGLTFDPLDDAGVKIWLAKAGAGIRDCFVLDGLLKRLALWKQKHECLASLIIRCGLPGRKAVGMAETYVLEWMQACRRNSSQVLDMTWQRRKLQLIHVLAGGSQEQDLQNLRALVETILPA